MFKLLALIILISAYMTLSGTAMASRIIVPKVDIDAPVGTVLDNGPMWVWNTRPGENYKVWIAGHRTTHSHPFLRINELEKKDKIYIKNGGKMWRYIVTRSKVIPESWVYKPRKGNILMLSACARWDGTPTSAAFRIVVFAKLDQ